MIDALSVAQLEELLAHAPVLFFVADRNGRFEAIAGGHAAALRLDRSASKGLDGIQFFSKQEPAVDVASAFQTALDGARGQFSFTRRGVRYVAHLSPSLTNGRIDGVLGVAVATASQALTDLATAHRALAHVEALSSFASYTLDLATEACGITPGFARIFGFPEETQRIQFGEMLARIHPEDRLKFTRARSKALAHGSELHVEYRVVRPSGEIRYVEQFGSYFPDERGKLVRGVGVVFDQTDALEKQRGIDYAALHDPLTGVLNRMAFERHVRAAVAESEASSRGAAVLFLDIDSFGEVNDLAGHAAGDHLLRAVAERLRTVRDGEQAIGRMGGDEFAMLFYNVRDDREAETRVASVRAALRAPIMIGGVEYAITASIGVAVFNVRETEAALLTRAHMAMLSAKAAGRSRVMWYTPDLERLMAMRHRIERDLTGSLRRNELVVHYQPIVSAHDQEVVAVEALVRWNHPELGTIAPAGFLDVAEQSGQLIDIGMWILEQACSDTVELSRRFKRPIRVNVNVAPDQLQAEGFAERALETAQRCRLDPAQIQIEVTEQSLINDVERAAYVLSMLRKAGFSIAIDDFGTGYNTLSYLKSYPVNCLKIDRMFVRDCESDEYSRAICRSLTALARSLGLMVIGEGIETAAQDAFLREVGCDELQGFYYGKPVAVQAL
ncbi:MAG TPA: EAL domain-containing protein [Candidatus Aquilonibacter sp.]|nr:EAL domain-containing protein [Candidatus Aquilonibacter sp.]